MALSFTVVTSFMASAVQVNAQGAAGKVHTHNLNRYNCTSYETANSEYHFVYQDTIEECKGCDYRVLISRKQTGYVTHDLRGVAQAPLRCYCLDCGYTE